MIPLSHEWIEQYGTGAAVKVIVMLLWVVETWALVSWALYTEWKDRRRT